jgi:hypothetical protein
VICIAGEENDLLVNSKLVVWKPFTEEKLEVDSIDKVEVI